MSNLLSIGLCALVFSIVYSRSISKKALELLSDEEKSKLAEKFSNFSILNLIPIIVVFTSYIAINFFMPTSSNIPFVLLILFFIIFLVTTSLLISKKMKKMSLPAEYVKNYQQSRLLYNLGFITCGAILLYELLK